jgi:hypothetical protein
MEAESDAHRLVETSRVHATSIHEAGASWSSGYGRHSPLSRWCIKGASDRWMQRSDRVVVAVGDQKRPLSINRNASRSAE